MFFNWFNTKEVTIIGVKLADNLSDELVKINNKNLKKEIVNTTKTMQKVFLQLNQYQQKSPLNFYKKSKLINEFRWRLLEIGYAKDVVDVLAKELVLRMK